MWWITKKKYNNIVVPFVLSVGAWQRKAMGTRRRVQSVGSINTNEVQSDSGRMVYTLPQQVHSATSFMFALITHNCVLYSALVWWSDINSKNVNFGSVTVFSAPYIFMIPKSFPWFFFKFPTFYKDTDKV